MFNKALYTTNKNSITLAPYSDITMLIEEKNMGIIKIYEQIGAQIEMCNRVLETGEPKTVSAQTDAGFEEVTIDEHNAEEYLNQANNLLIALMVYVDENDLYVEELPSDFKTTYAQIDDEIKDFFKRRSGLVEEQEPFTMQGKNKIIYRGW
jgi:hypothetical protein